LTDFECGNGAFTRYAQAALNSPGLARCAYTDVPAIFPADIDVPMTRLALTTGPASQRMAPERESPQPRGAHLQGERTYNLALRNGF
jgi:hypothetical protein